MELRRGVPIAARNKVAGEGPRACGGVIQLGTGKGAGAAAFLLDYAFRGSPASFLLFAGSDGLLALVTLVVLMREP